MKEINNIRSKIVAEKYIMECVSLIKYLTCDVSNEYNTGNKCLNYNS
jgi:hypothetical protein